MKGTNMEAGMLVFGVERIDDAMDVRDIRYCLTMSRQRAPHEDGPRDVRVFAKVLLSPNEAYLLGVAADLQRMLRQVVPEVQTRVISPPKPKQPQPLPLPSGEEAADAEA